MSEFNKMLAEQIRNYIARSNPKETDDFTWAETADPKFLKDYVDIAFYSYKNELRRRIKATRYKVPPGTSETMTETLLATNAQIINAGAQEMEETFALPSYSEIIPQDAQIVLLGEIHNKGAYTHVAEALRYLKNSGRLKYFASEFITTEYEANAKQYQKTK
ncbi:MAG: hypothetical protein LBR90_00565, partial [Elusimicrobiota bacterium]|nr:hypothetical protein [Elusimicrobiota bacterium]